MSERTIIAQCIVDTGYGTDGYDRETNEITSYFYYAGIKTVEVNPEYWAQYNSVMSEALSNDFDLPHGFDDYRLRVWSDGTKEYERMTP